MTTTPQQQGLRDGTAAYHAGIQCSPALDPAVTQFISSNIGEHRRLRSYLTQWQRGWVQASLADDTNTTTR